jgi:hypothetical protein
MPVWELILIPKEAIQPGKDLNNTGSGLKGIIASAGLASFTSAAFTKLLTDSWYYTNVTKKV